MNVVLGVVLETSQSVSKLPPIGEKVATRSKASLVSRHFQSRGARTKPAQVEVYTLWWQCHGTAPTSRQRRRHSPDV